MEGCNNLPNSVVPGISLSPVGPGDPCGQNGNTEAEITPTLAIYYSAVCEYAKKIIRLLDTTLGEYGNLLCNMRCKHKILVRNNDLFYKKRRNLDCLKPYVKF